MRPHQCHPIKRPRPHHPKMLAFGPEESRAERTQQPLVPGRHNKIGPQLFHIHGNRAAALAGVQQKKRPLFVARLRNARRIQQRAVVVSHHAHGNKPRSRSHRGDKIVRRDKPLARRNNFQFQAFAFLHRFPSCILQRKLALCGDNLVARLPRQRVRNRCHTRARPAGQRNLFRFSADQLRDGCADAVGHFEKCRVRLLVRVFICFQRSLHGANGNFRRRRLARQIQVRRIFNFEPLLPPIGLRRNCCGGHR